MILIVELNAAANPVMRMDFGFLGGWGPMGPSFSSLWLHLRVVAMGTYFLK